MASPVAGDEAVLVYTATGKSLYIEHKKEVVTWAGRLSRTQKDDLTLSELEYSGLLGHPERDFHANISRDIIEETGGDRSWWQLLYVTSPNMLALSRQEHVVLHTMKVKKEE